MSGETVSTMAILAALRTQLLTTSPPGSSAKLSDLVGADPGARLYYNRPPLDVTFPFGLLRLYNGASFPDSRNERVKSTLELLLNTRPSDEAQVTALEAAADVAQAAMLYWRAGDLSQSTGGLIFANGCQRDTLPPPTDAVDAQVLTIRLAWDVVYWPRFLTVVAHP